VVSGWKPVAENVYFGLQHVLSFSEEKERQVLGKTWTFPLLIQAHTGSRNINRPSMTRIYVFQSAEQTHAGSCNCPAFSSLEDSRPHNNTKQISPKQWNDICCLNTTWTCNKRNIMTLQNKIRSLILLRWTLNPITGVYTPGKQFF
jgi:hypothetical protein